MKLLVTLLAEPRALAAHMAQALGRSEAWVNEMIGQFREAGLDIEYDPTEKRYSVGLGDRLEKKLLPYSKRLARVLQKSELTKPKTRFVNSLERYTVIEFAEQVGTSPSNVANMINGFKGQTLPAGWVAYQLSEAGKWFITKMTTDRSGKRFTIPVAVKDVAYSIREGNGTPMLAARRQVEREQCLGRKGDMVKCPEAVLAHGFCSRHYYQQRKHPEDFPKPNLLAKKKAAAKAKAKAK